MTRRSERPRICILGCGLAGASVAYHLLQQAAKHGESLDVKILERASQPFAEASAQNAGIVRSLVLHSEERERAARSVRRLRRLPVVDWPHAPFRRTGGLVLLREPSEAHDEAADHLRELGLRVDAFGPKDRAAVEQIAPLLRSARFSRAYHVHDDGLCDPWTLGQGLLHGALRRGAQLETEVEVASLESEILRSFAPDHTVLATAAWTDLLRPEARLRPLERHLWQTQASGWSRDDHPWCWFDDEGLYLRPEAGGFLCSPCDETERRPALGPSEPGSTTRPGSEASRERLLQKLTDVVPALADLGLERGWSGLRTFRRDRRPLLGRDPLDRSLSYATGLGGSGVTIGLAAGEEVAESVRRSLHRVSASVESS